MGRIVTPAYRVEYQMFGTVHLTPAAWEVRSRGMIPGKGKPTFDNLAKHIAALEASFKPGGVNEQCGELKVRQAQIVRQSDDEIIAVWNCDMAVPV